MKIYNLNIEDIKRENVNSETFFNLEKIFIMNNSILSQKCQEHLKHNNKKNLFIKYNNKFYKFKNTSVEIKNSSDFCTDCDFKKECHGKLEICICEALFENDTEINLKEIEEYEIVFGEDKNEDI